MADPGSEDRNFPASPRKLRKARAEGQVARSRDWGHFVSIAVAGGLLMACSPMLVDWLRETLVQGLRFDARALHGSAFMQERLQAQAIRLLWVVLPVGGALMLAGVAATVAIGGWNWTWKPLIPNFGKLDPLEGLAAMVSKGKLVELAKATLSVVVLGTIGGLYFRSHIDEFAGLIAMPLPAAIHHGAAAMVSGLVQLVVALAAFASFDIGWQRRRHAERLKMSHQERKREANEQEGNPAVKAKVRARMRDMTRKRTPAAIPKADSPKEREPRPAR